MSHLRGRRSKDKANRNTVVEIMFIYMKMSLKEKVFIIAEVAEQSHRWLTHPPGRPASRSFASVTVLCVCDLVSVYYNVMKSSITAHFLPSDQ